MVETLRQKVEVPKTEVRWFTVSLNEIFEKMRLDAATFNPEAKYARKVVKECGSPTVALWSKDGFIEQATYPTRFKRIYVGKQEGLPFILPSQITEINPKPNKYISAKTEVNFNELIGKEGEILLTRSGTVGSCTIVSKTLAGKVFSDDVIRVSLKDSNDLGYVYSYLRSKIGQILINTSNYGAVIEHIEPVHLQNLPIPKPSKIIRDELSRYISKSFTLLDESNKLLGKAEDLLKEELKLSMLDKEQEDINEEGELNIFSISLKDLDQRFDASYHIPIFNKITKHLKSYAAKLLTIGDSKISTKVLLPGRFKRVYVEEGQGAVFFGGKQICELDPSNKKYLSLSEHGQRIKDQLTLRENMILVTCSGTVGRVTLTPKHWDGWTANQHIIRVVPVDDNMAGYLFVWLSTDYARVFIKKYTYGAVVDEITDEHVASVIVPLLKNENVRKKIGEMALLANKLRHEAYLEQKKAIDTLEEKVLGMSASLALNPVEVFEGIN